MQEAWVQPNGGGTKIPDATWLGGGGAGVKKKIVPSE